MPLFMASPGTDPFVHEDRILRIVDVILNDGSSDHAAFPQRTIEDLFASGGQFKWLNHWSNASPNNEITFTRTLFPNNEKVCRLSHPATMTNGPAGIKDINTGKFVSRIMYFRIMYFHRITLPTTWIYLLSLDLLQLFHLKAIRSIAGTLSTSSHIINKFLLSQT
jgi:hypothetical protein